MATMYNSHNGNAAVTHESDDTRPGKALCGRSIVGAINLDTLTPWARVGLEASSNGPCQRCSVISHALSVHPDRSVALAYRAGWQASAKIDGPRLEDTEDRYARTHTELEQDAFAAGWIDYASDYAYGTGIRPVSVATITVDNTPAGIYSAMMRANASEQTAPQSRLYGLLSDYLQRTLTNTYGDAGEAVYGAVISSGEASDDVISGAVADHAPEWDVDIELASGTQSRTTCVFTAATAEDAIVAAQDELTRMALPARAVVIGARRSR